VGGNAWGWLGAKSHGWAKLGEGGGRDTAGREPGVGRKGGARPPTRACGRAESGTGGGPGGTAAQPARWAGTPVRPPWGSSNSPVRGHKGEGRLRWF
jgi:hypothetical protein